MGKSLVIVESPTKAKTISKFLGSDFIVESSIGHIRDLPQTAKEIPEKIKKEAWARLGIDIENEFEPLYVVPADKKKHVKKLKDLLKEADDIYLATDEDREGESISWHLCEVLQPKVPKKRLVFHEITKDAIQNALANPREIDGRLVQAQETRRLVDRLFGYEISPLLWKKIAPRLSAGRVQSVAVKIIVERERERIRFVRSQYWDLIATFQAADGRDFPATLIELGGKRIASGKDFDEDTGKLKESAASKVVLLSGEDANSLRERLKTATWKTVKVEKKPYTTKPSPPFTTSTLQQEANRKLRLSARETMRAAQRLYENGLITYMRTDSVNISEEAITAVRGLVGKLYGSDHVSPEVRRYKTKVKNAQEAHEAIRPSSEFHRPEEIRSRVQDVEYRLYELIWKRTVACQMADAKGHRISIRVSEGEAVFQTSGKTIDFPGFLRAYVEGADDPDAELADQETILPSLTEGDEVENKSLESKEHTTQPKARFTEASLVKELEANGVGRPSTYASIIDTILRREYVLKQGNALVPTFTAFAVVQLLERFFTRLVDVQFTANMEDDLDGISRGEKEQLPYLKQFYFGHNDEIGLKDLLQSEIDPRESCTLLLGRDSKDQDINIRVGRYGPYLERGDERASIPEKMPPDELTVETAEELLEKGSGPRELGKHPEADREVYVKVGRFGPYVQLGDKDDGGDKPKMKSLLPGMEAEEIDLDTAIRLLSLPRNAGQDPDGVDIMVDYGRYGPYLKRGDDTRSLKEGDDVFTITVPRAMELLAEEAKSGWRARAKAKVLKELGVHPGNGLNVECREGRYGPYVTDGELNASLPKGEDPEKLTIERAVEILKDREEAGGKRKKKKAGKKKAAKKKASKKKAAKKKAAKKKATTKKKASKKKAAKKVAKKKTEED